MYSWQGTGESAVNPISKEDYYQPCDPETLAEFFCSYYGVDVPVIVEKPQTSEHWHGMYNYKHQRVTVTGCLTGLVIHELAHYIVHLKYGVQRHNPHGENFILTLQEMHDLWR